MIPKAIAAVIVTISASAIGGMIVMLLLRHTTNPYTVAGRRTQYMNRPSHEGISPRRSKKVFSSTPWKGR
ncbi:MAG: hypothetical protein DCC48_04430 [Acidobacteria bacterium]|nr:MAG: hypothetical protein DCC48_04430 [Acidobacteriota bacterium]